MKRTRPASSLNSMNKTTQGTQNRQNANLTQEETPKGKHVLSCMCIDALEVTLNP